VSESFSNPTSAVVARPPGSKVRVQVSDFLAGSGHVWEINTKAHTGDVYVKTRSTGKSIHISYHESGEWHYVLEPQIKISVSDGARYFGVAHNREDVTPGYKHALRVIVLKSELMPHSATAQIADTIKVPFDQGINGVCLNMYIAEIDAPLTPLNNAFPIAVMLMGDGRTAYVFAQSFQFLDTPQMAFSEIIQEARTVVSVNSRAADQTSIVIGCAPAETVGYFSQIEARIFD
jgi:hypothetical protein